jgi:hypothetical protein
LLAYPLESGAGFVSGDPFGLASEAALHGFRSATPALTATLQVCYNAWLKVSQKLSDERRRWIIASIAIPGS